MSKAAAANASLPKRVKTHLETHLVKGYCEQMSSQMEIVLQRLSALRVAMRSSLKDDTIAPEGNVASSSSNGNTNASTCAAELALLGDVLTRAHSEVYRPLVALVREVADTREFREEGWAPMLASLLSALLADLTLRESIVTDLGLTDASVLLVPKETMRVYISSVRSHPFVDVEEGSLLKKTISLINLSC